MALPHSSDKQSRDFDSFMLKIYKNSCSSRSFQRLPKCWNIKDRSRCLKLSHFGLTVTYSSSFSDQNDTSYSSQDAACVRSDTSIPLTTGIYYFEVTLLNKGTNGSFAVGVTTKSSSLNKFPGSEHSSFGYQTDGCIYHNSSTSSIKLGPRIGENDTVGCGVDFLSQSLFFTRNGIFLGKAFEGKIQVGAGTRLYPTVGLHGRGIRLSTNFGQQPFQYAFDNHIKNERAVREDQLIERICKEDFAGPKMKELVSGYLVHHGYVATAKAFSHWSSLSSSTQTRDETGTCEKSLEPTKLPSATSDTHIASQQNSPDSTPVTSTLQRRHSDSSCIAPINAASQLGNQLPGIASMLHRRQLRALCRRCQYGKAAATLNKLYPQVLERCPELLVQLRCRQLIEMMHRHAVRRGRSHNINSKCDSGECSSRSSSGSAGGATTIAPPKVPKIADSFHVSSSCCGNDKWDSSHPGTSIKVNGPDSAGIENGLLSSSMDIDSDNTTNSKSLFQDNHKRDQDGNNEQNSNSLIDFDEDLETGDLQDDDDDDDGFGMDDDTGLCISTLLGSSNNSDTNQSNHTINTPTKMDIDGESSSGDSSLNGIKNDINTNKDSNSDDEMRCLLRHVQFGRSLVNLVRQVRAKTGGLSLETERLLQQSVSLLAYPSPTSKDCPLRGLLDPVWRDSIASIINSAVLKAHDLPAQPALEQGLRALQRCFQDKNFVEAQTLGHFLLYHLTPAQLAKADEEAAAIEASAQYKTTKRLRSATIQCKSNHTDDVDDDPSSSTRQAEVNGHNMSRRRTRHQRRRQGASITSGSQSSDHTDECNSSIDEVNKEGDDDEDEEEEEEGRCDSDDDEEFFDNDDEDEDGETSGPTIRRPNTRSRQTNASHSSSGSNAPETRGPNGSSSGRVRSHNLNSLNTTLSTSSIGTFGTTPPPNVRISCQTVLARYCSALFNPTRTRLVTTIPTSSVSSLHRSMAPSRRSTNSIVSARAHTRSNVAEANQNRSINPDNQHFDSAFRGLWSLSNPHHAEFLAAMDDALKAYAGSLLLTDDEQIFVPSSEHRQNHHGGPPSPTGGGACAP